MLLTVSNTSSVTLITFYYLILHCSEKLHLSNEKMHVFVKNNWISVGGRGNVMWIGKG
jgi:hypothetical protein